VNYKKHPAYLGMVFVALVACGMKDHQTAKPGGSTKSNSVRSLEKRLAEIAGQANQAAPANIDSNTRLDGARAGPGLRLTSTYTLMNPESEGISSATFETKLTPIAKQASCKNPDLPQRFDASAATALGFTAESSFDEIISVYLEDELGRQVAKR
jgi:hypothetical protein